MFLKKRYLALFIILIMLVTMLAASIYLGSETHHLCRGHHCQVCVKLERCESIVKHILEGTLGIGILLFMGYLRETFSKYSEFMLTALTLVSLKVKLSN